LIQFLYLIDFFEQGQNKFVYIFYLKFIMKKEIIILCFVFIAVHTFSNDKDTTYWKTNFKTGLTFNLTHFSSNWKGGGNDAWSIGGFFIGKTGYKKGKLDWVNQTDLQYGRIKNDGQDESRKSVDKLSLDLKVGYKLNKNWNAFTSLSFLSQFDDGNEYIDTGKTIIIIKKSGFFAPAYITSTWGVEYKPSDVFYARISPFSPRITIVNDTLLYKTVQENYGVKPGDKVRYEWKTCKITANFEKNIVENISVKADYELFANFEGLIFDNIDHRLSIFLTAKIYKFLNLNVTCNFIKDIDQVNIFGENGDKENKWQSGFQMGLSVLFNYQNTPQK